MPKKRATYAVLAVCLASALMLARSGKGAFAQGPPARTASRALAARQPSYNVELVGETGGSAYAVVVQWPYAYICLGRSLVIFDVSDPTRPRWVGQSEVLPGVIVIQGGLAVSGGMAYMDMGDEHRLRIIDVSNPAAPHEVGAYETPGGAHGVAVSGGMAYVVGYVMVCLPVEHVGCYYSGWLRIIDVSDPAAPHEVGAWGTSGLARGVALSGGMAYVAAGLRGLRIIDVSNPAAPHEVGACDTPGWAHDVALSGGMAYVAAGSGGLRIIDVSNPAAPYEVAACDTAGSASDVAVSGTMAYVLEEEVGEYRSHGRLRIVDVSNAAAPHDVGAYQMPQLRNAYGLAVSRGMVYVAAGGEAGLLIFRVTGPRWFLPVVVNRVPSGPAAGDLF